MPDSAFEFDVQLNTLTAIDSGKQFDVTSVNNSFLRNTGKENEVSFLVSLRNSSVSEEKLQTVSYSKKGGFQFKSLCKQLEEPFTAYVEYNYKPIHLPTPFSKGAMET